MRDGGRRCVEGGGEGDQDLGDDDVRASAESAQPGRRSKPQAPSRPTPTARRSVRLTMPEMGESVTEGTVLEWHK